MSSQNDETRELMRELHGLIKDAERVRRENRADREALRREVEETVRAAAVKYVAEINSAMERHVASIARSIDRANAVIEAEASRLAGVKTAEEFINAVVEGMVNSPRVGKELREALDDVAAQAILNALKRSPKKQHGPSGDGDKKLPPAALPSSVPLTTYPAAFLRHIHLNDD